MLAFPTKMSTGPNVFLVLSKASFTAAWFEISATKVRTLTHGCWDSMEVLVVRREEAVRPRMDIFVAPEAAKAWAILGPIPEPPPVMKTPFPAVDNSGRIG